MKFVRRELSVREDRLFHSIRASFAGIIPCKKKKVQLSETDDGIFYHTNLRFFIKQYRNIGRRKMNNSVFFVLSLYNSKQAAITGRSDNLCPAVPLAYLRTNLSLDKYDKKHITRSRNELRRMCQQRRKHCKKTPGCAVGSCKFCSRESLGRIRPDHTISRKNTSSRASSRI